MNILKIFLIFVFIISPFVDMYNGYVQQILNYKTLIPVVFKMSIILFSLRYILYKNHVAIFIRSLFVLLLICFLYWEHNLYTKNIANLSSYLFKLFYPYAIIIVFYAFKSKLNKDVLLHFALAYGTICAISILLSGILGIAVSSYGDDYGYGIKGLFNAGNDLGLSLVLCNCISLYYICKRGNIEYIFFNILLLVVSFQIGSVAGILGSFILVISFIIQSFIIKGNYPTNYSRYRGLLLLVGMPIIIYTIYWIVNIDSYTQDKFNVYRLISGGARSGLEESFYIVYANFNLSDMFFGVSPNEFFSRIGSYLYGVSEPRFIELDHWDLIGSYGIVVGGLLLLYPVSFLIMYIKRFLSVKDNLSYWMIIAFLLFIFHGLFAGHAFTSISAMTILTVFMFIANLDSTDR